MKDHTVTQKQVEKLLKKGEPFKLYYSGSDYVCIDTHFNIDVGNKELDRDCLSLHKTERVTFADIFDAVSTGAYRNYWFAWADVQKHNRIVRTGK